MDMSEPNLYDLVQHWHWDKMLSLVLNWTPSKIRISRNAHICPTQ